MDRARLTPEDFRRHHLAEWEPDAWAKLADDTWHAYDKEATAREVWFDAYGRRLPQPRMMPVGLPVGHRHGFGGLLNLHVSRSFAEAKELGFEGTLLDWRQRVKWVGQHAPRP